MTAWISPKRKQEGPVRAARLRAGHALDVPAPAAANSLRRVVEPKQKDHGAELEKLVLERTAELRQALEAAQRVDKAKDAFIANVSHELRTPLGAVTGLSALALEHCEDARQRNYLEKICNAGRHMARIINDLLDLSKVVAGRMEFENIPFRLRAMIQHAEDVIRHKAETKDLRLRFRIRDEVPDILIGDPLRLEQIMLNLIGNAIKFTASGGVEVRVAHIASADGRIWLVVDVEDSGVGIRSEDLAGLFQPFAQADVSTSRKYGGTGLGLALSQHLAQLMDGGISISSREGIGSIFSLKVRLGAGSAASLPENQADAAPPAMREHYENTRILVVEDDSINIEIVGELLGNIGITPRVARNGQEALAILTEAGPGVFDLVLMDIQMPVMDGLTATRRIRTWPRFDRLPIIAMTAHALKHEKLIGAAAGMNDHVVKPFDVENFYRMLAKWLPARKKALPDSLAAAPERPIAPGLPALHGIDTAHALKRFGGNEERYRHWLMKFVEESPAVATRIREALAAGQLELAARTTHSFKGGVGTIGLCDLHERAAALEAALKTSQATEPELQQLEGAIEAARKEIISALGL
ncbi:MAG: ATP-binding protein [Rhodocyclales bacterium]|nr:ATP-binding protein [Rhodocyclales bacterium]